MSPASGHAESARMFENRLRKRHRHLRKWARRHGVSAYRVYDRDIPEIPLAVDLFAEHLLIARYLRDRGPSTDPDWLAHMAEAASLALDIPLERIHIRNRERQRGKAQYERLDDQHELFEIQEAGHWFAIDLDDYLDTGLFLDHRPTRAMVAAEARGKRFLNLFCYTASFTVYAARAGAVSSVSIDLSNRYLAWARHNLERNHIDTRAHQLVRADVLAFLEGRDIDLDHRPHAGPFDLAVLDPPTFSNSKKMRGILDVQRDHVPLIERTLERLVPGGVLYFSTNSRRFKFDQPAIRATEIRDITAATTDEDFRQRPAHRAWRLVK